MRMRWLGTLLQPDSGDHDRQACGPFPQHWRVRAKLWILRGGIIRHGAKMLSAYGSCATQKITVILRKACGGSYLAMCSQVLGADMVFAWPTSEIASPYVSASNFYVTDVIEPQYMRWMVALALRKTLDKRELRPAKKHGNVPM